MSTVRNGLGYRVLWAGFALALAAASLHEGTAGGAWSRLVTPAAWGLFAVAWFLCPLVPAARLGTIIQESSKLAIGSAVIRTGFAVSAFGLLLLGQVLRFWRVG